jgi:spore germination protein YaaH
VRQRTLVAVLALVLVGCGSPTTPTGTPTPSADPSGAVTASSEPAEPSRPADPTPVPTPRPAPGHEVYGYVPYWEMGGGIADHLAKTKLTTLALFSVATKRNGTLNTTQNGYKRITGAIGKQLIREAHDRGVRVELVYTSFGYAKNQRFFTGPIETQDKAIKELVGFADDIGVDGINVDVELIEDDLVANYGAFVGRLRDALRKKIPDAQVSVATTAGPRGASMARAATDVGADRVFLMGYDYHWAGSAPGASSPMDRRDGEPNDLVWSLDLYESMGVPIDRTLLGLPLYGMAWPVASAELGAPETAKGDTWIPRSHLDVLEDPKVVPVRDPVEVVEFYALPDAPKDGAKAWQAVYLDSPETLTPKLELADDRGLAGAGFWAIGYERGLPAYTALIKRFAAGKLP